MTEENDIDAALDNVADFTAYKMRSIVADLAKRGHAQHANAVQDALDAYLLGDIGLDFIDGWPHVIETVGEHDT